MSCQEVLPACVGDIAGWLDLAREVEPLFGPMVGDPNFIAFLERNVKLGTAFCARSGPAGSPLSGAIVLRVSGARRYEISWLAVAPSERGAGVGTSLVATALCRHAKLPCTVTVVTFGPDHPGRQALHFYERLGFELIGSKPNGPDGGSRVELQLTLAEMPSWSATAQPVTGSVPSRRRRQGDGANGET